ncbi:hypothetical protein MLD38_005791 [Melastoma candidum]|uniref:Uncharacterized protein n=1 Tax=Melastoma candidum TaxID=119954 RepID=A0ACB9RM14_9MYRT|nr:hypothetical protein MLD38_005791 [Melastoma candidum]
MQLATLIRAGSADPKLLKIVRERARVNAAAQETTGVPPLNFSIRILVLGRSGVGKSTTINSIFDQIRTVTSAFQPATDCITEVRGVVHGLDITFIDTPGFLPASTSNSRRNREIMLSIRRFVRKSPPDLVMYFERLDLINMRYSDFPLLKLATEVFGKAIWLNTILVMTHALCPLPEGSNGFPVIYDSYVSQCSNLVQRQIHQAVLDSKLENPVQLVENHPNCKKNSLGEKVLHDGQVWITQLLLLCVSMKVLNDASNLLGFKEGISLGPGGNPRQASLPHLLSNFLRHRSAHGSVGDDEYLADLLLSEANDQDEYDQLPPIRILTKSQFEKLTRSQKRDYLDELDYREMLYMKKQLREELQRQKNDKLGREKHLNDIDDRESEVASSEPFLLPDMAIPPSFDPDCLLHRYRGVASSDRLALRPVLDPHGWDHDVGFDGVNFEAAVESKKKAFGSVTGQMSKDKNHFSVHSECAATYRAFSGPCYSVGLDLQSAGKDLIYTLHSTTKMRNSRCNIAGYGFSLTSFGKNFYTGAKIEDTLYIGRRVKLTASAGRLAGAGKAAHGGSFEVMFRGSDFPVRNESISLSTTVLSFEREMVLSGNIQSEFPLTRGTRLSVACNLNSRRMGQLTIRTSSSEHLEVAAIALLSLFRGLFTRKAPENTIVENPG